MAEETQYTANTGWATISTANTNLNGTGTLGTVLTGASNGTLIKSVMVKAITNTGEGMVRLFVDDGSGNIRLLKEIPVPAITKSSINPAFEVKLEMNFTLKSGCILKASTELSNTFNVIAEGLDWAYYATSVRTDTTQYLGNTGTNIINTANSNLDGTGSVTNVYVSGSPATYKGTNIETITIKCVATTSNPGMVRLYLNDGSSKKLFTEVFVRAETSTGTSDSFERTIVLENDLDIKSGWTVMASTENAQTFHITVEGHDWKYLT
jgi:hypothetical protein